MGTWTTKSTKGDDAEGLIADPVPVDGAISDAANRRHDDGIVFDLVDGTRMRFPNQRALAVWLAVQARIRKSNQTKEPIMATAEELEELRGVIKANNLGVVIEKIVDDNSSYGLSESDLVDLISNHERNPDESPAQCFTRNFCASTPEGALLRKAVQIAKEEASIEAIVVEGHENDPDDAAEATAALNRLMEEQKRAAPWMSTMQAFDAVMAKNVELTNRAIRRPAPTTNYPMPK